MNDIIFLSDTTAPEPHMEKPFLFSKNHFKSFLKSSHNNKFDDHNIVQNLDDVKGKNYFVYYDCNQFYVGLKTILKSKETHYKTIVNDLKNNKCKLIIHNSDTTPSNYDEFDSKLYSMMDGLNINYENVIFILQELVLNDDTPNLKKLKFPIVFFNILSADILSDCHNHDLIKCLTPLFESSRYSYRDNYFISFNNNIKQHRIDLLSILVNNNIIDKGMTSWFAGQEPKDQGRDNMSWDEEVRKWIGYSKDLKVELTRQDWLNPIPHMNSYFNIITESNWGQYGYDEHTTQKIFFSEKTWKSIITYQPFILISTRYSLKKLKELGFKTFSPHINEDYDNLRTYEERIIFIESEINRICNMSKNDLDEWYWNMEEILRHNFNHFFNFVDSEFQKIEDILK